MNTREKSTRFRPTLESLESMKLLSTIAPGVIHAAKATPIHVEKVTAVAVVLKGTIHATGKASSATVGTISGSGGLGKVGTVSFKATIDLASPPSGVVLTTKHGKLYLAGEDTLFTTGMTGSTHYTIIGGTGTYAHATGSGDVTGSYTVSKSGKLAVTLKFSA